MGAPFVWFDLTVADGAKVAGFYQGLFGWETGPGAGGYQDWLLDGGQPWAGTVPAGAVPAGHWIPYVAVDNLAVAASQAVDLGGTVIRDKVAGPAGNSDSKRLRLGARRRHGRRTAPCSYEPVLAVRPGSGRLRLSVPPSDMGNLRRRSPS